MMPVIPIAKPAIAPCVCPYFIAVPVPMACPVPPKARPTATGSSIFSSFKKTGPRTLVRIPVATTTTRVTVAIPYILSVIPTAIAVVTDFGKREIARKKSIPNHFAIRAVKTVLTIQATKIPKRILRM